MNGKCMMIQATQVSMRSSDIMTILETDVMTITIAAMAVPYNLIFYLKYFTGINRFFSNNIFISCRIGRLAPKILNII